MVRLLPDIAEVLARGSDPNKQAQVVNWTTGQDAADALIAYDLLYNDPSWTEAAREKVEGHFQSIGKQIEAEPSSYHLCNTSFYYQVYRVLAGCFFDNREWIDTGLDNPGGFKSLLTTPSRRGGTFDMRWYLFGDSDSPHRRLQRFRGGTVDGGIWNETGSYGLDAVLSQMCFIAEAMLHYDGTNLYEYEAPGGGCLRNYFRFGMARSFSDGQPIRFGANGEVMQRYVPDVPGSDRTALRVPLPGDKRDLAYLRCGDPEFAWAALQVPGRRGSANKWGYCALWHGLDASEMEVRTPDMRSISFPGFGIAVLRSTEGPGFWNSDTPTVAVRWGEAIYRAHPDQFGFQLHAFGRGIEPDINYPWDYGVPQGGRNPTPFGYSTYAHNCLVVDRRNYSQEAANLVVDDHGEHARVIGLAGSNVTQSDAVQNVDLARWLVLCKEYLLDVSYIGDLHLEHTFDLSVPTFGTDIEVDGAQWEDYDVGADIGYGKIDTIHDLDEDLEAAVMRTSHPPPAIDSDENVWLKDGRRCKLREPFTVRCKHPDGIHLALHYGGWSECEMMTAKAPLRWHAREGVDSIPGRFGVVINRKIVSPDISGTGTLDCSIFTHSEDHCHYFVVHEPYQEKDGTRMGPSAGCPWTSGRWRCGTPTGIPWQKVTIGGPRHASWRSRAKTSSTTSSISITSSPCAVANPAAPSSPLPPSASSSAVRMCGCDRWTAKSQPPKARSAKWM
jgi:hypothetical protein